MIPLGSCTMKLNAVAEMESITWPVSPGCIRSHRGPTPKASWELIATLEKWLVTITGYDKGEPAAQRRIAGRVAGLLAISQYTTAAAATRPGHLPDPEAHGTNAASAVMAGMRVVVVGCRENGDVDVDDLRSRSITPRVPGRDHDHLPGRRTAFSNTTSPTSVRWCTTPAARSTSMART